ncbi:MAG: hypothetical protein MUE37_03440 [Bacteroidales bacterium]|jgi:hypothetical protein|nr:hypothetical protein [Bacteroidales bacterium]
MALTKKPPLPGPDPIEFPMHALNYLEAGDLNSAQRKAISVLYLEFLKSCSEREIELINGMILEIRNLSSKG